MENDRPSSDRYWWWREEVGATHGALVKVVGSDDVIVYNIRFGQWLEVKQFERRR